MNISEDTKQRNRAQRWYATNCAPNSGANPSAVRHDQAFKSAMCKLAGGVVVLTTADREGQKFGLTMTAVISTSLNPPLLVASIDSRSRVVAPLKESGRFAINILSAEQEHIALRFAGSAGDKFAGMPHQINQNGLPEISGASAVLDCAFDGAISTGDHTIVVGRVVNAVSNTLTRPLVYYQRQFFQL